MRSGHGGPTEASTPIDASGQLSDGTRVDGPVSLREALLRRREVFVGTVTEKLLTYALGRARRVLRHAGGSDDRPPGRTRRLPVVVDRASGVVNEPAVSDRAPVNT